MSHREKIAWLSLIAMAVTFGPYFTLVASSTSPAQPLPDLHQIALYAVTAVAQMLILGAGYLYFRLKFPQEARTPPDERDRTIKSHAIRTAYYVLIGGMILVGCVMPFKSSGWSLVNAALFMIVAAEVVRSGVEIVSYRRQA